MPTFAVQQVSKRFFETCVIFVDVSTDWGVRVKRREFITLLGGAAAWPIAAQAQQAPEVPRVGFVYAGSKAAAAVRIEAILSGLRVSGYAPPAQVEIVARTAEGDPAQIAPLVAEVIAKNVNVFIVNGPVVLHAAHLATRTIPIIALDLETDPVAGGVAASLARPGGGGKAECRTGCSKGATSSDFGTAFLMANQRGA